MVATRAAQGPKTTANRSASKPPSPASAQGDRDRSRRLQSIGNQALQRVAGDRRGTSSLAWDLPSARAPRPTAEPIENAVFEPNDEPYGAFDENGGLIGYAPRVEPGAAEAPAVPSVTPEDAPTGGAVAAPAGATPAEPERRRPRRRRPRRKLLPPCW